MRLNTCLNVFLGYLAKNAINFNRGFVWRLLKKVGKSNGKEKMLYKNLHFSK